MVDGIPFGGSYNETGGGNPPDFDPGDLERIEVLRGPQGTLYGASNMGGLVNYITVDPSTERFSGRVQAGYSSVYNGAEPGFNVRASVNIPISDKLAIRASGFERQDPGYIDNPILGLKGVNRAQADGARLAALWTPTDKIFLKVSALYQYYKQDAASDVVAAPGLGRWQQNYIAQYGGAVRKTDQVYSAILNVKLGSTTLTSATGYNVNDSYNTLDFGYSSFFENGVRQMFGVTGAPYIDRFKPRRLTEEERLAGSVWKVDWLVGAYYSHQRSRFIDSVYASNAVTGQIVGLFYPFDDSIRTGKEYAGFANATLHVTDRFDLQLGGRESHVSLDVPPSSVTGGIFGSAPNVVTIPNASASVFTYSVTPEFKISPDLMVYGKASSGFRPGYGNTLGASSIVGNIPKSVGPDQTKNYEVGAKGTFFDHKLTLDGSLYYIDWTNLQISLQSSGLLYHANGSAAKSEGVELAATVRPFRRLTIEGWIDYDDAALTEPFPATSTALGNKGDRLPITPRWSSYLSATKEFPLWSDIIGFVGGDVSFVGDRLGNFSGGARTPYPGYTKVDVRTGVKVDTWG
jgi:iron complex outermembrane recepter protein